MGQIADSARRAGYTVFAIVELGDADYYGWVRPAAFREGVTPVTMIEDETGLIRNFQEWDGLRSLEDLA